jgi:protoporphyrinogen oxidase
MKIAVVGAGLSGLTAALRFKQAGHEVELFELNNYPGGRCKAFQRDGFIVDTCPELAATSYRRWLNMIDEVGLKEKLVTCPSVISILKQGKLIDIDMAKPLSVAFTPALSWRAKLKFLAGVIKLRKQISAVPHYLLDNISLEDTSTNAEQVSLQYFGKEVTENLIEPLLRPIGGVTLDMMSTLLVPYTLSDWTQMVSLQDGLESLPKTMAKDLTIHYETTVTNVDSGAECVTIETLDKAGNKTEFVVDKCLITTPFDQAEAMFSPLREVGGDYHKNMSYMKMLDVKLAYSKAPASKASMVMLSVKESPDINVISLSHNKSPDRAPAGHALFSIFTEHKQYDKLAAMTDDEVVAMMREQIETLYPEVQGSFLFSYVARQERVSYVPDSDFFHRTKALWDAIGNEPRVQLGGDIFMFGGLEAAVASGERAAERLMKTA